MKTVPPFPVQTPLLENDAALAARNGQTQSPPSRLTQPLRRWFQQVAAVSVPEFAEETPLQLSPTLFQLQQEPNPASSLAFYFTGSNGALSRIAPSQYRLSAKQVIFNFPPSGTGPYATYRY